VKRLIQAILPAFFICLFVGCGSDEPLAPESNRAEYESKAKAHQQEQEKARQDQMKGYMEKQKGSGARPPAGASGS